MGRLRSALGAALTTTATQAALSAIRPAGWERTSYRGTPVALTGGAAVAAGTLASSLLAPRGARLPAAIASASGAIAGYVDDHLEDAFPAKGKGFSGHLGALKDGKVTSGLVKIAVVGAGAAVSGTMLSGRYTGVRRVLDAGANTVLIATTANLVNLLDLRPGRALKVSVLTGGLAALRGSATGAGAAGTALASLPTDLAGETMLGDLGANALGAHLGVSLASDSSVVVRLGATGIILALTALSEKVSFSQVIADTPALKALDDLGRS